jgi:hypothetical protein
VKTLPFSHIHFPSISLASFFCIIARPGARQLARGAGPLARWRWHFTLLAQTA